LEAALADLRAAGALVLLDVKRGDIGSTVEAYASAYLDPSSPLYADAITAAPYLGVGSLAPMVERARACGGGVVVLALTSNPEASTVQHARLSDGRSVAQHVVDEISQLNAGVDGLGSFGVVVGATTKSGEQPADRALSPADVLATVYRQLGIDTRQQFLNNAGRPISILGDGEPIRELIA